MIFSSFEFFVFLGLVLAILSQVRDEGARRNVLLVVSYLFYGWGDWRFCFLRFGTTLIDYLVARRIETASAPRRRRAWLLASLISNLGVLVIFKYMNFFIGSLAPLLQSAGIEVPHLKIILPVGISFFTFQSMSYVIDVYRGSLRATRNLRDFTLFVAFFPQLVAGPIVRGSEFLPQMDYFHPLKRSNLQAGMETFIRGFTEKALFADTLAVYVDPVFAHPAAYASLTCWLAVTAYAAQIYYDFSGYTDMAIGLGRMLGFEFPVNFRHPCRSLNITEFWRRWHITLSSWLRDYLYIPLGGNRSGRARTYVNLMATMLLGGLWHGASWTFVVWGALHGVALAVHKFFTERRGPSRAGEGGLPQALLSWAGTFVFVLITWVFFRSSDFDTARVMLSKMAFFDPSGVRWYHVQAITVLVLAVLLHVSAVLRGDRSPRLDLGRPLAWSGLAALLLVILLFAPFGSNPFIYFQF